MIQYEFKMDKSGIKNFIYDTVGIRSLIKNALFKIKLAQVQNALAYSSFNLQW